MIPTKERTEHLYATAVTDDITDRLEYHNAKFINQI